jgi:hypothetical protein
MYDSVTAADIPRGALMVAGYVDGAYAWTEADWNLHAKARWVRITVGSGTLDADVADVENGDYTPATAAAWGKRKLARGDAPGYYISESRLPQLYAALSAAGMDPYKGHVVWVALWDGVYAQWDGATAKQYQHPPGSGGHYDLSWVADYWPGIDPPPVPAPAPPPPAPGPTPPPPPGPTPPPGPPPPPTPIQAPPVPVRPSDPGSAQSSFWGLMAYILGRGIPDLFNAIGAQLRKLRDL